MKIELKIAFGTKNFVSIQSYDNLNYGTVLSVPSNGKILIINNTENTLREPRKIDGNIINPKKGWFKKVDPNSYTIVFINSSITHGETGGKIDVPNENLKPIQYEELFYRIKYAFKVVNSQLFYRELVDGSKDIYDVEYFTDKISEYINIYAKKIVAKSVTLYGIEYFDSNLTKIKKQIEEDLYDNILGELGIELKINSIEKEEKEKYKKIREDLQTRIMQRDAAKEVK